MAHILIIDDSPTERHFLRSALINQGHQITTAENGEKGVEIAANMHPDLILMDVVMPGMNGFQATRKLSRLPETADIPIVMVTTKNEQTDKVWATRQGAKGYLIKPVEIDDLLNSLQPFLTKQAS